MFGLVVVEVPFLEPPDPLPQARGKRIRRYGARGRTLLPLQAAAAWAGW